MHRDDEYLDISSEEAKSAALEAKEPITERYAPTHFHSILKNSFTINLTFFKDITIYESQKAFIFPPLTDGPSSYNSISALHDFPINRDTVNIDELKTKIWLFPIVQVGKFLGTGLLGTTASFFSINQPRNHWVTLHYDPTTKVATLIDSRPQVYSSCYNYATLLESFNTALNKLGVDSIKKLKHIYQGIQNDDVHCGPWTALNIETLAIGHPLESIGTMFKGQAINEITEHFTKIVSGEEKKSFVPLPEDLFDIERDFNLPLLDLSEVTKKFEDIILQQNPETIAQLISERGSLRLGDKAIEKGNPLSVEQLELAFRDLERTYAGMQLTKLGVTLSLAGFSIKDPGRLTNHLQYLEFQPEEINKMGLRQVIIYDIAIHYAMTIVIDYYQGIIDRKLFSVDVGTFFEPAERLVLQKNSVMEQLKKELKSKLDSMISHNNELTTPKVSSDKHEEIFSNTAFDEPSKSRPEQTSYFSEFLNLIGAFFNELAQIFIDFSNAIVELFCRVSEPQTSIIRT